MQEARKEQLLSGVIQPTTLKRKAAEELPREAKRTELAQTIREEAEQGELPLAEMLHWDDYRRIATLGQGAFGRVYGVERVSDGKRLAIKLVNPKDRQTAVEIAILSRLSAACPDLLVRYYGQVLTLDPEESDSLVAGVLMDWLSGPTLRQLMDQRPKVAWLLTTLELLAEQLACVHAAGIVHRDIKPENIVFDSSWAAKLIDYGVGCSAGPELSGIPLCTAQLTGTPAYLAPELLHRRLSGQAGLGKPLPATPASDIWALGATMYEWLLGETLKHDLASSFASHTEERIRTAQADPRIPPLVRSMLAIDPTQRPSAQQIVDLLNQ